MQDNITGPRQAAAMPEKGAWRETPGKRQKNKKKNAKGCICLLGYFVAFMALLPIGSVVASILKERGISAGNIIDLLGMDESLAVFSSLRPQQWLLVALLGAGAGLLVAYLMNYKEFKELDRRYKASEESAAQAEYDKVQVKRWKKYKKSTARFWVAGLVLVAISFFSVLVAKYAPYLNVDTTVSAVTEQQAQAQVLRMYTLELPLYAGFLGVFLTFIPLLKGIPFFMFTGTPVSPQQIILNVLQQVFTEVTFERESGIPKQEVDKTRLLYHGNSYKTNDYIRASYRGLSFAQSDVSYYDYRLRGDRSESVEIFSGRWLSVTMPKTIEGVVYLYNKPFKDINKKAIGSAGLQKVEIEDMAFNGMFEIYAQNPQEVFYLLTPALIERLKAFAGTSPEHPLAEGVGICCLQNQIHFAVSGVADAFRFIYVAAATEAEVKSRIAEDISLITDTLDALAPSYIH
ncbi:MAG: DUF3137 domain-containing protein [Oscillospiraceae bacterium]